MKEQRALGFPVLAGGRPSSEASPRQGNFEPRNSGQGRGSVGKIPPLETNGSLVKEQCVPLPLLGEHWTVSPRASNLTPAISRLGLPPSEPRLLHLGGRSFCQEERGLWTHP